MINGDGGADGDGDGTSAHSDNDQSRAAVGGFVTLRALSLISFYSLLIIYYDDWTQS